MLQKRYQLLMLSFVVLLAYYPAIFGGLSIVDDQRMVEQYMSTDVTVGSLFHASSQGPYYRPVALVTFGLDKLVANMDAGFMHTENILFHLINAVLVFFLMRQVLSERERDRSYLPLIAALLFGLHPICTESVDWISGRTDLVASLFILACTVYLLKFRERLEKKYLLVAAVMLVLGSLTKEIAFAFLPGALLLMSAVQPGDSAETGTLRLKYVKGTIAVLVVVVVLFVIARLYHAGAIPYQLRITYLTIFNNPAHAFFVVLRAFAFYVKKLIVPYPLNFFIMEIDPLYQLVAVPLMLLCIYIAARRTVLSALFIIGVFLMAPAFLIVFKTIAWAPYAERFLYLSSAFFIVSAAGFVNALIKTVPRRTRIAAALVVLLIMGIMTFHRAVIWQQDRTLIADTVAKSPNSLDMRVMYGLLLTQYRELDKAAEQFVIAQTTPPLTPVYDARPDIYLAFVRHQQGRNVEALTLLDQVHARTGEGSIDALNMSIFILSSQVHESRNGNEKDLLRRKLIHYNEQSLRLVRDGQTMYRLGVLYAEMGAREKAIDYFKHAGEVFADDDPYKGIAKRKADKLLRSKLS
ncbi:MAG: glycosyltransferase family 39 protein [Nitrospiraceae bacterium]|nr:glycosyltransferase family 39 protein [Nitrospiraceae bacterium]